MSLVTLQQKKPQNYDFENPLKILIFVVYESITLETFGDTFLPLINSFEFLQILGILQYKKNSKEFLRGKNVSPKVSKVIDL